MFEVPGADWGPRPVLLGAGATIPSVDLPTGKAELDAVLREHGLM